jgi:hypothetical protein
MITDNFHTARCGIALELPKPSPAGSETLTCVFILLKPPAFAGWYYNQNIQVLNIKYNCLTI